MKNTLFLIPSIVFLAQFLSPSSAIADRGVINAPTNFSEAIQELILPILPEPNSSLIDRGNIAAVRGFKNMLSPYAGASVDIGAYERGLGVPFRGPRKFTDLLAFSLPSEWQMSNLSEIASFTALGAPSTVAPNSYRLLIKRSNPEAYILVTFEVLEGESRWNRLSSLLAGESGDGILVDSIFFRDGLGASLVNRGGHLQLLGARVDDEGVLSVLGGAALSSKDAIQDELFSFMRSLNYPWNLQSTSSPISVNFSEPVSEGVVLSGAAPAPLAGNSLNAGELRGDVTFTSASIIWDVAGDDNLNATASIRFRRKGTTFWQDGVDLTRTRATGSGGGSTSGSINSLAGSLFHLSPGTEYEVEVSLIDPENSESQRMITRSTSLTTRPLPKLLNGGRV
ncbi:MAG: hypothetical protein KDD60_06120, partial [Bdellovibrionales bacterium]|nr:hypothetical protein [Bdellovibrionales bacterium]